MKVYTFYTIIHIIGLFASLYAEGLTMSAPMWLVSCIWMWNVHRQEQYTAQYRNLWLNNK